MNPQIFGVVMDRLYAAGALEVFYMPVQMKKNRPGTLLTVVAPPPLRGAMTDIVFRETTTIGLRHHEVDRECLERAIVAVETPVGTVRVKVASRGGHVLNATPEFEDCAKLAAAQQPAGEGRAGAGDEGLPTVKRFFLTTAIDYVNSRPHLGTAYEKICADVIARYKRLCGFETRFLMGNDEHSQNVFKKASEDGLDPLAYCDQMEREFRTTWAHLRRLVRRLHPHHRAAPQGRRHRDRPAAVGRRRHLRGRLRRLVLRQLRGVQAGEGSRQRQLPAAPDAEAGVDQREELLLPAVEVPAAAARSLRGASGLPAARRPPQRDPQPDQRRADRHLGQPRRAVVGHPAAVRSGQRRLRLVRRADQLRVGGRPWRRPGAVRQMVAGGPARDRQGHHAVPRGDLAGDADGGEAAAAAPRLRPRLHDAERSADEQDARHDRRSDRGRRSPRRRSAAALPGEGSRIRRRRRLLVGPLRRTLQRRPGE